MDREPSGTGNRALSESSTLSSMLLRKLSLWFSRTTETVTWLSFCRLPCPRLYVCEQDPGSVVQGHWGPHA